MRERLDQIAIKTVETGVGLPPAARTVSDYYRKTGRLEEAIVVLQKHVEVAPDSLTLRTRLGLLHLYAKQEEDAPEGGLANEPQHVSPGS